MEKLQNVLLIDDDTMTNYLHKRIIEGFEVSDQIEIANDGEEGLQIIENYIQSENEDKIPQLIFVDIDMPLMDGFQFLEAYQSLDFKNKDSVVVAVLTSSFNPKDVNRAKELSVDDYLVKPLTKDKMMELMERHFGWHAYSD